MSLKNQMILPSGYNAGLAGVAARTHLVSSAAPAVMNPPMAVSDEGCVTRHPAPDASPAAVPVGSYRNIVICR